MARTPAGSTLAAVAGVAVGSGPGLAVAPLIGPLVALALLSAAALPVQALEDQWYVGLGGSAARLRPDPADAGFERDEEPAFGATVFVGRDLDERSSVQLQLHGLGEAAFESGETVDYLGADAAVLYRFLDTRDGGPSERVFGASLYARLALGWLERDGEVSLEDEAGVHLGAGAGIELHLTRTLALRAEGLYHERDASSANLSLVARFGGGARRPLPRPPALPAPSDTAAGDAEATAFGNTAADAPADGSANAPDVTPPNGALAPDGADDLATGQRPTSPGAGTPRRAPSSGAGEARATLGDRDGDGVRDADDTCPRSAAGYPVRDNGCALLDGVLSGVTFVDGTAELEAGATEQLDYLADLLAEYPRARVELLAHTDDRGSVREQSILTRARLRTAGTYLVQQKGVRANRLVLRSFGGTRPIADNATAEGRRRNNRIEVVEKTG